MYARKHLPLIGVGPIVVIPQLLLTIIGIIMTATGTIVNYSIDFLNIPFILLGVFSYHIWNYVMVWSEF